MGRLFLAFTIIPVLELMLLLRIGRAIGFWPTVALVILTGFVGAFLARQEGMRALREVVATLQRGELPHKPVLDALAVFVGGALLLTPGVATDAVGLMLLLPATRGGLQKLLLRWFRRSTLIGRLVVIDGRRRPNAPQKDHAPYDDSQIYDDHLR